MVWRENEVVLMCVVTRKNVDHSQQALEPMARLHTGNCGGVCVGGVGGRGGGGQ